MGGRGAPCRRPQNVWGQLGWEPGLDFQAPSPVLPIVICSTLGRGREPCAQPSAGVCCRHFRLGSSKNLGHSQLWKQLSAEAFGSQYQVGGPVASLTPGSWPHGQQCLGVTPAHRDCAFGEISQNCASAFLDWFFS